MKGVSKKTVIAMLVLLAFTKAELSCSKFDFEEKVLDKIVRLEYKVEQTNDKMRELDEKVATVSKGERDTLCPNRMTAYEGSCYFVGTTAVTLPLAQQFCQDRKAKLVQIDTPQEQLFLSEWLAQLVGEDGYWMDLTDMNTEGTWTRFDGNTPVNFTDWRDHEPNNSDESGIAENCARMERKYSYQWNDVACTRSHYPLCEYRF